MDNSTIVLLINDQCRAIEAQYEDGGKVHTFETLDPEIEVDDLVVVQSGTRHEMTVVKVTAVDVDINFDTERNIKWVVQRVDTGAFSAILTKEDEAIATVQRAERERKKQELRESLFKNHEAEMKRLAIANVSDGDPEDLTE